MNPNDPAPWLIFIITLAVFGGALLLMAGISAGRRGWWTAANAPSVRSVPPRSVVQRRKPRVLSRSGRLNAKNSEVQTVQAFTSVQDGQPDLPTTIDELQRLAHAVVLYSQRQNKQIAIESAWQISKGGGDEWQRASELFDRALSPVARAALKQKKESDDARA